MCSINKEENRMFVLTKYTLYLSLDPKIKATVRKHLLSSSGRGEGDKITIPGVHSTIPKPEPICVKSKRLVGATNGSCALEQEPLLGKEMQVTILFFASDSL